MVTGIELASPEYRRKGGRGIARSFQYRCAEEAACKEGEACDSASIGLVCFLYINGLIKEAG